MVAPEGYADQTLIDKDLQIMTEETDVEWPADVVLALSVVEGQGQVMLQQIPRLPDVRIASGKNLKLGSVNYSSR